MGIVYNQLEDGKYLNCAYFSFPFFCTFTNEETSFRSIIACGLAVAIVFATHRVLKTKL